MHGKDNEHERADDIMTMDPLVTNTPSSDAQAPMEIILVRPRGFCAGVVRAIEIVEAVLEIYGLPVFVLHEIVHNHRVVEDLRTKGAVFVETLDEVPDGSNIIFSAHGVSTAMVAEAQRKRLRVIDATCPLVTKVHLEVARHAREAREVVLIGHAGHPEVIGTLGCYDRSFGGEIYLVQRVTDVAALQVRNPDEIAFVTQTTLSVNDTGQIIAALRERFPRIVGPRKDDICYATQSRQNSVRNLAGQVDLLLVVGSHNSSNSNRLREVGEQQGLIANLVQDAEALDRAWFRPGIRIGVTAGASAPEVLVHGVLEKINTFGPARVTEMDVEHETVAFPLPASLTEMLARKKESSCS